ncbi:MAG: hypothetical protein ABJV04_02155 [Aliiglaciecola sp.]
MRKGKLTQLLSVDFMNIDFELLVMIIELKQILNTNIAVTVDGNVFTLS